MYEMIVGTTRIQKIARIFQIRGGNSRDWNEKELEMANSCTSDFVHSHFRLPMKMQFLPYYCTVTFTPVLLLSPALSVTVTVMAVVKLTSTFPDEEVDVA